MDNYKNLAEARVSGTYDADDVTISLHEGDAARLPTPPFNAHWWNATRYPNPINDPNYEMVRVTAKDDDADTVTVTRAQEGTSASTKNGTGTYGLVADFTAKLIDDIQDALDAAAGDTFIKAYRTTDGTPVNNSTAMVADDTLLFAIGASEVWTFEARLFWDSVAGTDMKVDISGPASPTFVQCGMENSIADGPVTFNSFSPASPFAIYNPGNGIGDVRCVVIYGTVSNGSNAGNVAIRIAQAIATSGNTKLLKGSSLIAHKVSA